MKKQIVGYEKRHSEFSNLQKENALLRRQLKNSGITPTKGGRNDGVLSSFTSTGAVVEEKKKKSSASSATAANKNNSAQLTLDTKNSAGSEETTDLDRIMSQQFSNKNNNVAVTAAVAGGGGGKGTDGNNSAEKNDGSKNHAMVKKFQELNISTSVNSKKSGGVKVASSSSATTSSATPTSSSSDNNNTSSKSNISSANTKIPISVTSSSNNTAQKDDEFDAEIDMVDFFAKSQAALDATTSSSSNANDNSNSGDQSSSASHHSRSHVTHKMKKTETDDRMPSELVGGSGSSVGDRLSPSSKKKDSVGDNLLSSLDAFEASFASAFPETSFSINSEAPSSTQLDMAFDVPDFDPFSKSKSPANKGRDHGVSSSSGAAAAASTSPKLSSSLPSSSGGGGATVHNKEITSGGMKSPTNDLFPDVLGGKSKDIASGGMKSQMKDLFPDSALTTSPKRGLDLTFDSTFPDMDLGGNSGSNMKNNSKGKGKSLSVDKLDSAFSRAHSTKATPSKASTGGIGVGSKSSAKSSTASTITPLDMNAEIEQLDALAEKATTDESGDKSSLPTSSSSRTRSIRKVKTPLSYAEPSTKQKLRRGDEFFPKVDAERKLASESKRNTSPTTDLDRIMSEHFSVSGSNKKDGTMPS